MTHSRRLPTRVTSLEEFRTTLKLLLGIHYDSSDALDRSWTFRYSDEERRDLMVEVTHLRSRGSNAPSLRSTSASSDRHPEFEFEPMLRELLIRAQEGGIAFDRSWRFQFADTDPWDLMVEITYLEKRTARA
ncbi:hypothetical protein [Haladaptatus caseinilyticus]|uniref:hypothetical protein n=1 Tax=Haladaptatus caseinilyticus TaxID=2993314 RepID=UPI00224B849B|nr:hypothetical protein [Haladaptatus caseinilyticus]